MGMKGERKEKYKGKERGGKGRKEERRKWKKGRAKEIERQEHLTHFDRCPCC